MQLLAHVVWLAACLVTLVHAAPNSGKAATYPKCYTAIGTSYKHKVPTVWSTYAIPCTSTSVRTKTTTKYQPPCTSTSTVVYTTSTVISTKISTATETDTKTNTVTTTSIATTTSTSTITTSVEGTTTVSAPEGFIPVQSGQAGFNYQGGAIGPGAKRNKLEARDKYPVVKGKSYPEKVSCMYSSKAKHCQTITKTKTSTYTARGPTYTSTSTSTIVTTSYPLASTTTTTTTTVDSTSTVTTTTTETTSTTTTSVIPTATFYEACGAANFADHYLDEIIGNTLPSGDDTYSAAMPVPDALDPYSCCESAFSVSNPQAAYEFVFVGGNTCLLAVGTKTTCPVQAGQDEAVLGDQGFGTIVVGNGPCATLVAPPSA